MAFLPPVHVSYLIKPPTLVSVPFFQLTLNYNSETKKNNFISIKCDPATDQLEEVALGEAKHGLVPH